MRVLLDFTQIPLKRTGVGVYAENLLRELPFQFAKEDVLVLLLQSDELRMRDIVRNCVNVSVLTVPSRFFRNRASLMLFEQLLMPILLLKNKIDVVHSLHYTHPIISHCPRVVTIHDLTLLLYPDLHTTGRKLVLPFFIKHAVRHAEGLIFVSQATRSDAEKLIPGGRNIRSVIPLGVDLEQFNTEGLPAKLNLEQFSIKQPFILFVGTIEPRKNVPNLIRAFELIAKDHPDLSLVLAGQIGWNSDDFLRAMQNGEHKNRVFHLGFIEESEKRILMGACAALVYPSLYEGFGLPVLEAMAAGAPVIASNVSSLPEVAGHAAILIDPLSVKEIADALTLILIDPAKGDHLRTLGKQRAANFSWSVAAKRTYEVYKQVADKPPSRS